VKIKIEAPQSVKILQGENDAVRQMMKSRLFSVLTACLLCSGIATAAPISTPMSAFHLFAACSESETNEYARGFCSGAIDAFYSSIPDWCVPASVTHGEVKDQIKNELLTSDPLPPISAFDFVNRSVQKAWPCP